MAFIGCHWNYYQAPSIANSVCTHKASYNDNEAIVNQCLSHGNYVVCTADSNCVFNFYEQPGTSINTCTHTSLNNANYNAVTTCKLLL